jgi:hypothetical protein
VLALANITTALVPFVRAHMFGPGRQTSIPGRKCSVHAEMIHHGMLVKKEKAKFFKLDDSNGSLQIVI